MEIAIEWKDGLVEVVSTLEDEKGPGPGAQDMATMARVRFDLFEEEGLRIDFWRYSAIRDRSTALTRMLEGDLGEGMDIPNLNLEPCRVLRLIDRDQLDDVVSITVDEKWRIRRYGDMLINETRLDTQCLYWLGKDSLDWPLINRVIHLHERIRQAHSEWKDGEIADSYGFPCSLWAKMAAEEMPSEDGGTPLDAKAIAKKTGA